MRRVGGELSKSRIDGYPVVQENFRPGVVVELAADVRETGVYPGRNSGCSRERDEELRVLVAIAAARPEHLQSTGNAEGDAFGERIINPLIDPFGDDARVALAAGETLRELHDLRMIALDKGLGHRQLGHHAAAAVGERIARHERWLAFTRDGEGVAAQPL